MSIQILKKPNLSSPTLKASRKVSRTRWRALFSFSSHQHRLILVIGLLLSAAAGITGPALAIFFGKIFNNFTEFGAGLIDGATLTERVAGGAVALCIIGGAVWLLKGGYFGVWMVFGELQAKVARDQLFQNLLEKDLEWYELRANGIGALLPRLQTYVSPNSSLRPALIPVIGRSASFKSVLRSP